MNSQSPTKKATVKNKKKTALKKTGTAEEEKPTKKLTRAEYDNLRQIEWVPFDPYED